MKVSPSILDRIGQTPMVRLHRVAAHLPVPVLADLVERGVVAGVKDSSTNLTGFRQLVLAGGGRADVAYFSGSDGLLDAALQVGANGSVAGLANVAPELFVAALRAHRSGDAAALADAQRRIVTLTGLYTAADPGTGLLGVLLFDGVQRRLRNLGAVVEGQRNQQSGSLQHSIIVSSAILRASEI